MLRLSFKLTTTALAVIVAGCVTGQHPQSNAFPEANASAKTSEDDRLVADLQSILAKHAIGAAAIGILRDGKLVDEIYFGTRNPEVPIDSSTRFEVASVTKTAIAETVLRLVAAKELELDEPLSRYWIDPDLAGDPRVEMLTPRLVLSHQTGFPNWRFFRQDGRLVFERDPGTGYTYSGEGFQYLGRALERKLGKPLPEIVEETLFRPLGMASASIRNDPATAPEFAMLRNEDGQFFEKNCRPGFCFPEHDWNAAGLMTITLRDYAKLLSSIASADGYGDDLRHERDKVWTVKTQDKLVDCQSSAPTPCPDEQGYGLGYEVARTGSTVILGHGGFDWSTVSNVHIDPQSGDGAIVFLTGPNGPGLQAMAHIQDRIGRTSPYAARYRQWAASEQER